MNPSTTRIGTFALLVAAGLLPAACGGDTPSAGKIAEIDSTLNEAYALEDQLTDAVNRLSVDCMGEKGFTLHPLVLTQSVVDETAGPTGSRNGETPDDTDVPTLEAAEKQGFGYNIELDPDSDEVEDEAEEDDPYDHESEEYREEYETALYGEEYYKFDSSAGSGEYPLEGGCVGEVSEAVYGEPTVSEGPDGEPTGPHYGPAIPLALVNIGAQTERYDTDTMMDARYELVECVEDKGYPYFEYEPLAGFGMSNYVDYFYEANQTDEDLSGGPGYDLPEGAPWPFDEAFAAEVEFATTVAQCADDTGFRKTSKAEWDKATATVALETEAEVYAWHDDIEKALGNAQELLGE